MKWKKQRFQRIMSLLLAVVMCLSMMQGTAWASELLVETEAAAEQVDIVVQDDLEDEEELAVQGDSTDDVDESNTDAEIQDILMNEEDEDTAAANSDTEVQGDSAEESDYNSEMQNAAVDESDCDTAMQDDSSEEVDTIIIEDISVVEDADTLDSEEYIELPSISATYINPLYEDVLTEDDLVQPNPYGVSLLATAADYETYDNAVNTVRSQLKKRYETVGVMVKTTRTDFKQIAHDLMDDAMAHNGNAAEGDYLRWLYGGWSVSIGIAVGSSGTTYYITYTYTVTYHATAEQEEAVTAKVASLLTDLGLTDSSKSDYEKVKIIYDYICDNVTYDYTNLDNSEYKLKFTAYAALMNGTAVCQGYALLFYRLALECGIDARLIAGNNNTHAWNIAKVGSRYYNLDATWDYEREEYAYFLKCTSDFGDHTREAEYDTSSFHAIYPMGTTSYLETEYQVNSSWTYDNGILLITDAAAMCDYESVERQPWYALQSKITEVIIADDITSVGAYAFAGCTALTAVTIGASVTEIGSNAFAGCTALSKIVIPSSVTTVANDAFTGAETVSMVLQSDGTAYDRDEESIIATIFEETLWCTHDHSAGSEVQENTVAATCAVEGSYEAVTYCTVCLAEMERTTEVIVATGNHTNRTAVQENVVEATCKDGSYDSVVYCLVCKQEVSRTQVVVEATEEHTEAEAVVENEVAATCTADGSYDSVVYCSVCEEELSRETKTVTALGHTSAEAVKENEAAATCTADGSYDSVVYCSVCEEELSRETKTVTALGHTSAEAVVENEVAATCTAEGSYDSVVYCSVCEEELSRETKTVTALGHTSAEAVVENEVAATCTAEGSYDSVVYCSVCEGELSRETKTVTALGHTSAKAVKENEAAATCTADGSYDSVVYCSVCEGELSRDTKTITASGHTAVTDAAIQATCTTTGKTAGSHCSVCGTVLTAQKETAATGHKGEWVTTAAATVFEPEQQSRTCTVCGKPETREVGEPAEKFISFNASSLRLRTGQTTNKFVVSYGNGDSIVSLKLNKKNIIKVTKNKDGSLKIKALKKTGTVKLKITLASKLSKTITIKVVEDKITTTSLKLTAEQKKVTIKKGDTFKLLPIIKPITSQDKVKFTTSNKKVATVTSGGVVKGRKKGTAKITIRSGKKKVVCTVKVN